MLDHEKLTGYQVQLKFPGWVNPLLEEVQRQSGAKTREVRNRLDRASLSVLLNIAEGNGKRARRTRVKSFDDARGSTSESAACLDALVAKRVCGPERVREGKRLLEQVYAMLSKLIARFEETS